LILENNFQNPWLLHDKYFGLVWDSLSRAEAIKKILLHYFFLFGLQLVFLFAKTLLKIKKSFF